MLNMAKDSISVFTTSVFRTNNIFPSLDGEQKAAQDVLHGRFYVTKQSEH